MDLHAKDLKYTTVVLGHRDSLYALREFKPIVYLLEGHLTREEALAQVSEQTMDTNNPFSEDDIIMFHDVQVDHHTVVTIHKVVSETLK